MPLVSTSVSLSMSMGIRQPARHEHSNRRLTLANSSPPPPVQQAAPSTTPIEPLLRRCRSLVGLCSRSGRLGGMTRS